MFELAQLAPRSLTPPSPWQRLSSHQASRLALRTRFEDGSGAICGARAERKFEALTKDESQEISSASTEEYAIEMACDDMEEEWKTLSFNSVQQKQTGTAVITEESLRRSHISSVLSVSRKDRPNLGGPKKVC